MAHTPLTDGLNNALRGLDLDDERVQLVDQLIAAGLGALIAAAVSRRRFATLLGVSLYLLLLYILPFARQVQASASALANASVTETLLPSALYRVLWTLLALCMLAAAVGTAAGAALHDITVHPLQVIGSALWDRWRHPTHAESVYLVLHAVLKLGLATALVLLVVSAANVGPLLTYGISSNLLSVKQPPSHVSIPTHGTVRQGTYYSTALKRTEPYEIYLPPSYALATAMRYPTFYLLHGSPGSYTNWFAAAGGAANQIEEMLVASGKMRETIIVSPDGNGPVYRDSQWANAIDGRQRMEDAIVLDLVHFIDTTYRTLPDPADRAIGGNSEGGYGAVNIALHHPDVFSYAASTGGYFEAPSGNPGIFGAGPSARAYRLYNSPGQYVQTPSGRRAAQALRFLIGIGTQDGALYQDGIHFSHLLSSEQAEVELITVPGGHQWWVWRTQIAVAFEVFESPSGGSAGSALRPEPQ